MQISGHIADVSVGSSRQYRGDIGLGNAEQLGYVDLRHSEGKLADRDNFLAAEQLLEQRYSSNVDRVLPVEMVGSPFQVVDDIVRFDAVDMVDDWKSIRIWDERESDQPMDMDGLTFSLSEKIDVSISKLVRAGAQYLAVYPSRFQTVTDAIETSHSTKGADFIEVAKSFDRNRSPFFRESDIHTTGCPSGNGGLTIKDPSHASTFGGSAIMALASDTYNGRLRFL